MNRHATKLVLFLLLGAIVNVAVAWGCAIWSTSDAFAGPIDYPDEAPPQIRAFVPHDWLLLRPNVRSLTLSYRQNKSFGQLSHQFGVDKSIPFAHNLGPGRVVHLQRAGWPSLSLQCVGWLDRRMFPLPGRTAMPKRWYGGIQAPLGLRAPDAEFFLFPAYQRPVPVHPLWPGFAINTIFYAAVLWVLFAAPGFVKRRIRRGRGRCIHCGYDLRGHTPGATPEGKSIKCPECGGMVLVKSSASRKRMGLPPPATPAEQS